jgi:hypothetical protein
MRSRILAIGIVLASAAGLAPAASKPHVITFGKWMTVRLFTGPDDNQALDLKLRGLYADGKLKDYTFGLPHEITERLFVVQRVVRVNDALASDGLASSRWVWQRSGWLVVDRTNGRVAPVGLPDFDPDYSLASWYRDYVAYCGISDESKKLYAVVMQLGRRKPVLKKLINEPAGPASPDSGCTQPAWQRQPPRVTFLLRSDQRMTYVIRSHAIEIASEDEDDEGSQ